MKLLCKLFGHRPAFGYGDREGEGYFRVIPAGVDGIGRHHARLQCECERCGATYTVGYGHLATGNDLVPRGSLDAAESRAAAAERRAAGALAMVTALTAQYGAAVSPEGEYEVVVQDRYLIRATGPLARVSISRRDEDRVTIVRVKL